MNYIISFTINNLLFFILFGDCLNDNDCFLIKNNYNLYGYWVLFSKERNINLFKIFSKFFYKFFFILSKNFFLNFLKIKFKLII